MDATVVANGPKQGGYLATSITHSVNAGSVVGPNNINNIKINSTIQTQAVPNQLQTGSLTSNLTGSAASKQSFRLTQDGGWIALLVLSSILVLISGKSCMMLSKIEGLTQRISASNDKRGGQA